MAKLVVPPNTVACLMALWIQTNFDPTLLEDQMMGEKCWHGLIGLVLSLIFILLEAFYFYDPTKGSITFQFRILNLNEN